MLYGACPYFLIETLRQCEPTLQRFDRSHWMILAPLEGWETEGKVKKIYLNNERRKKPKMKNG